MRASVGGRLVYADPPPLNRGEQYQPFFIVGSGRSGTTLLRRILQQSPEIHIPPETWALPTIIEDYHRYRRFVDWDDLVSLLTDRYVTGSGFTENFHDQIPSITAQLRELEDEDRSLAAIINCINCHHGSVSGASFTRWGDKTPFHSFHLNDVHSVFPDARYIHLIRDGADFAHSCVDRGLYDDIGVAGQRWCNAVRAVQAFARRYPRRVLEVRYERFVTQPSDTVDEICRFLGLSDDASDLQGLKTKSGLSDLEERSHHEKSFRSITSEYVGEGRRQLSPEQRTRLGKVMNDDLTRLGYDPLA